MAQTTAQVLSSIFKKFASDPVGQHRAWAKELWEEQQGSIVPAELNCDDALVKLLLAEKDLTGAMIYGPVPFVPANE